MSTVLERLTSYPIVPVYYHKNFQVARGILDDCFDAGLKVFEFTNRGIDAIEVFRQLVDHKNLKYPEMALGVGTVLNQNDARHFIDAGAEFIVQPGISKEVAEICKGESIPWIPGVLTPTEIMNAGELGADMIKIFPGNLVGSQYIKSIKGPFRNLKIMVTGGVDPTVESINEWFNSGVNVVGIGSKLFGENFDKKQFKENIRMLFKEIKLVQSQ
ncbi:bifunctional 4-hydroxy-2-oxoglutarate aldolase/2-dehydro-3-deoxy-phosphogluconate aldolase [Jiulongibacter sediminis]|jgi:2-dehydro-3-deoxyphosphogluconate aldolase/(4S)-4-hydroxy-2-oxoglutarate aldolase|uniref:bifunctional 4-hydroxy-2-oxoglutarate aldolase/2-dehydro-3-deoxy-phosphogluconate aldolase n=1 Tax=Jiulongibacter sediminis TaxID=1605367 RepID=UPI0026F0FC2E|nr:bifunctional 4-hydroxy-2-oxoglutarate aldolase/2-dehydro-3-deoxy-phosphogluconate aldolase [Jiulongibacter sediminis]